MSKKLKKYSRGGSAEGPSIYVADLAAYNEGKLVGEWVDLTDFSDADDLMDHVSELLERWSEESGEKREEYAIHDTSNIPEGFITEYSGKDDFEKFYEAMGVANDIGVPVDVIVDWMSETGEDGPSGASDSFQGKYDDMEDFAYRMVEDGVINDLSTYLEITETDRRILAGEEADNYIDSLSDDELIEMAGFEDELSELEEKQDSGDDDFDFDDEKDDLIEKAKEKVRDEEYDRVYEKLDDPIGYFVDDLGAYSEEDLAKANFIRVDYEHLGRDLSHDYKEIRHDGESYIFSNSYARGGRTRAAISADKRIKAKHPGRRVSESGNVYYENRVNRSDENRSKRFAQGGELDDFNDMVNSLLDFSAEAIDNLIEDNSGFSYENYYTRSLEGVETKPRPGFIPFTDGGVEFVWFEYANSLLSSGTTLPTNTLQNELLELQDAAMKHAVDVFKEKYPEIAEKIGDDKINYHDLYNLGYGSEAERLSEWEREYLDDESIMFVIGAYLYDKGNTYGAEGGSSMSCRVFCLVNMEAPYHRRGFFEDRKDIEFSFKKESDFKMKFMSAISKIAKWMDGGEFKKGNPLKKKIYGYAKGGDVGFDKKVSSISKKLSGKKVNPKYQKGYGKKYSKQESVQAAKRIAGAQVHSFEKKSKGGRFNFIQSGKTHVLNNQYLPHGFGRPADTYYYIVDEEGKVYHKDGKFRQNTLIQLWSYAYKTKEEADRTSEKLNQSS